MADGQEAVEGGPPPQPGEPVEGDQPGDAADAGSRSEPEDILAQLFRSGRLNAMLSWLLVAVLAVAFVESVFDADWLWTVFVVATGAIVVVPPTAFRDWRMMLPWELLLLALLPVLVRAAVGGQLGTFAYYLSIAGLALIVTAELHMFTELRMTHWFAVVFVVMTTMASVAAWAVVRWNADRYLGTTFLSEPGMTQDAANAALMVEFLWVTLAGFAAGVIFDVYYRRRDRQLRRRLRAVVGR